MQRIGWRDRIADNLHICSFLQLPSSSGRPFVSFTTIPGIYPCRRPTITQLRSIDPQQPGILHLPLLPRHIHIHISFLSFSRALHSLVRLSTSTFALYPRFSFPQCTLILYSFRVSGRRTRRRVPQPPFSISLSESAKPQWNISRYSIRHLLGRDRHFDTVRDIRVSQDWIVSSHKIEMRTYISY